MNLWLRFRSVLRATRPLFRRHRWMLGILWTVWAAVLCVTFLAMHGQVHEDLKPAEGVEFAVLIALLIGGFMVGLRHGEDEPQRPLEMLNSEAEYSAAPAVMAEWRREVEVKALFSLSALWLPVWLGTMACMISILPAGAWPGQALWAAVYYAAPLALGLGGGLSMDGRAPLAPLLSLGAIFGALRFGAAGALREWIDPKREFWPLYYFDHDALFLLVMGAGCIGLGWLLSAWFRGPGKIEFWEPIVLGVLLAAITVGIRWMWGIGSVAPRFDPTSLKEIANDLKASWNSDNVREVSKDPAVLSCRPGLREPNAPPPLGPYEIPLPDPGSEPADGWMLRAFSCRMKMYEATSSGLVSWDAGRTVVMEVPASPHAPRRAALWIFPPAGRDIPSGKIGEFSARILCRHVVPLISVRGDESACLQTLNARLDVLPMDRMGNIHVTENCRLAIWKPMGPQRFLPFEYARGLCLAIRRDDGLQAGATELWRRDNSDREVFEAVNERFLVEAENVRWEFPIQDFTAPPADHKPPENALSRFTRTYSRIERGWIIGVKLILRAP